MTSTPFLSLALLALARPSRGQTRETPPHQGCQGFLKEDHTAVAPRVGAAFEAAHADGPYRVADEAGPTAATCADGAAAGYACAGVDLLSVVDLAGLCAPSSCGDMANDLWG